MGVYQQGAISAGVDLLENVPHFFEEDELVGVDFQKKELVNMLVGEPIHNHTLGDFIDGYRTTLASIANQSAEVQQHFDCHAWINVSQSYNFENLFRRLTKMMCPDQESLLEMDMVQELISCLNRYLMKKSCGSLRVLLRKSTELHDLRTVKIERGALPLLEELKLGPGQNDLSFDIQNLKILRVLQGCDMYDEFVLHLCWRDTKCETDSTHLKSLT
ncbi:Disease resistance protein RPM1 [Morus notabilis]|uniref:Disease resistance protein RPM1 n=1 Tax=Morus notabilis TaxID=981085 RepID=W9QG00_9ROSA|nr:Disease resistance protein RPM1 [Morus notabilis]